MIEALFHAHPILLSIGSYFLFSSIVGGMPDPVASTGMAYRWAYTSLHLLAGNLTTAFSNKYPQFTVPEGSTAVHKETTLVIPPPAQQ